MMNPYASPSPTCIPLPQPTARKILERMGVKFNPEPFCRMSKVILPPNWGIYCIKNGKEGDKYTFIGVLMNDSGVNIAVIYWGYTESPCTIVYNVNISLCAPKDHEQLDPKKYKLENGWYVSSQ